MSQAFLVRRPLAVAIALTFIFAAGAVPPAAAQQAGDSRQASAPAETEEVAEDELFEPSNTGYIDSAVIRNRLRIRYDAANDGDRPDRAEFIYGKCRCFTLVAGQDAASRGPTADLDYQEVELTYERVFAARWSAFVEVPFRSIDLTLPAGFEGIYGGQRGFDSSGVGDVRAGVKYGFVAEPDRHLTLQVRAYLPTGDAFENLGTDHASIEPGLLYFRRLGNRWAVESEARLWVPLDGSSDPETGARQPIDTPVGRVEEDRLGLFGGRREAVVGNDDFAGEVLRFGVGASRDLRHGAPRWTPVVELVGWYVLGGYSTPPTPLAAAGAGTYVREAESDSIVNLKIGARISVRERDSIYFGYGLALSEDVWYDDIFRIEYRRSF